MSFHGLLAFFFFFFLVLNSTPLSVMYLSLLIHLPTRTHIDCFKILTSMNKSCQKHPQDDFCKGISFQLLWVNTRVIMILQGMSMSSCIKKKKTAQLSPKVSVPFCLPTRMGVAFVVSLLTFVVVMLCMLVTYHRNVVVCFIVFICISLTKMM